MGIEESEAAEGLQGFDPGLCDFIERQPPPIRAPRGGLPQLPGLALGLLLLASLMGATQRKGLVAPSVVETKPRPVDPHPGCLAACHQTHRPLDMNGRRILRPVSLDAICLSCHGGSSQPTQDLGALKLAQSSAVASRHGMPLVKRSETAYRRAVQQGSARQAGKAVSLSDDCSACHDVHGKEPGMLSRNAFDTHGQLLGIKPVNNAQRCFGCHAGPDAAPLHFSDPDLGALFGKGSLSSHGIGQTAADRPDLPSLRAGAFRGKLDCTSCHDNPDPNGARGPHASPYPFLLKASYVREGDVGNVGDRANELCFVCHDRHSIESNRSFPLHREHLSGFTGRRPAEKEHRSSTHDPVNSLPLGFRMGRASNMGGTNSLFAGFGEPTPCATCHDPHGSAKNPVLIRFDKSVVTRSSVGGMDFYRNGLGHGTCTLTCHGYDHIQTRY